jgi:hypothetical protein
MRIMLAVLAILSSTAALAQNSSSDAPADGDKPPVHSKPKGAPAAKKPQSMAAKLQECLDIEDGTKGRLDCYDAIIRPQPKTKPAAANGVMDCRFVKEEDARLECFNGFAERIPKLPHS